MLLYHGSSVIVDKPEIRTGDSHLDFGAGFYTTTSEYQAQRWAKIKMRRSNFEKCFVTVYEFDFATAQQEASIVRFEKADLEWLNFVVNNRRGYSETNNCDMHIGPVADDNVYATIRLYETNILGANETLLRLKTEVLQDQWVFHNAKILSYLKFREYKEL